MSARHGRDAFFDGGRLECLSFATPLPQHP